MTPDPQRAASPIRSIIYLLSVNNQINQIMFLRN